MNYELDFIKCQKLDIDNVILKYLYDYDYENYLFKIWLRFNDLTNVKGERKE